LRWKQCTLSALAPRRRRLAWCAVLVTLAAPAAAGPAQDYRKGMRAADKRERVYFGEFRKRLAVAWDARRKVLVAYQGLKSNEIDSVNDAVRALWEELVSIERDRGEAAGAFARSGDPGALGELLKALLTTVTEAEDLDNEILFEKSRALQHLNDQAPAFRRAALALRLQALGAALGAAKECRDFLAGTGWSRAASLDKSGAVAHRVAILDLLDASQPVLRAQVTAEEYELRIVAAERLAGAGPDVAAVLIEDGHELVRRAILQAIRRRAGEENRWIVPVLGRLPKAEGGEREEAVRTLEALTGAALGDDVSAWQTWYEARRAEIDGGKFHRGEPAGSATQPQGEPRFYGIPIHGRGGVLFLCEWGHTIMGPCDNVFQRTRPFVDWFGMDMSEFPEWEKTHPSQRRVFLRQFRDLIGGLPATTRVGLVLLADGSKNDYPKFQAATNVAPAPLDRKNHRLIEKALEVAPGWSRWQSPYAGLLIGMQMAGVDPADGVREPGTPAADTFVLVSNGALHGARYLLPEHVVADFTRRNRFRRVRVHTVHIGTEGREAQRLLEGLARASGGTYVRVTEAP
jgi:hypothetical protein